MSQTNPHFKALPDLLQAPAEQRWNRFIEAIDPVVLRNLPETLQATFPLIFSASPFIAHEITRDPSLFSRLIQENLLQHSRAPGEILEIVQSNLDGIETDAELFKALRRIRNLEMVRIAWRDIADFCSLEDTLTDLSLLAEAAVESALAVLFKWGCSRYGTPRNREGEPQNLIVLGMGKLGARELNFSSDIDLILGYRDDGVLDDRKETSYAEFYARLARNLVQALSENTEDGFVFRVDTRLRPFGESGPLVMHFEGLERYYEGQAREWERYAMIKARAIAGDPRGGAELEAFLKPFIYRRYLDYRAFGELRDLKRMIALGLARKGDIQNVKLGRGGIREIEFIGQAFQLIRGGFEKSLQCRGILEVLSALGALKLLPENTVHELQDHYRLLRRIENRLQEYGDQQTHTLPTFPEAQASLAHALGFDRYETFQLTFEHLRNRVHEVFEEVIRIDAGEAPDTFPLDAPDEGLRIALEALGISPAEIFRAPIEAFRASSAIRRLSARGRHEIQRLLPALLRDVQGTPEPLITLERLFKVLEAIASRNVYLTLLAENPEARHRLIALLAASPWFVSTLSQYPLLLDDLLDTGALQSPLQPESLKAELLRKLEDVDPDDLETFLLTLRRFRNSVILRVAAADIGGTLTLPEVSNALTALAETLLREALRKALSLTRERHGHPSGLASAEAGFGIIAYGKLGGLELGYGSDLDLVFLYAGDASRETDGPKPLTAAEYYARLAQRVLHILNANTSEGILYDTDLRLRPSGNSGLLVSSLEAFETYQMQEAWTWEQQALIKARFVAGDPKIGEKFREIRQTSLCRPRDRGALAADIREMRLKMRTALETTEPGRFDLKQGAGGIVDIEFLVQFWVLAGSNAHPRLTDWTDVLRILECLFEASLISDDDRRFLQQAYFNLRGAAHRAQLDERKAIAEATPFQSLRNRIQALWLQSLGPATASERI